MIHGVSVVDAKPQVITDSDVIVVAVYEPDTGNIVLLHTVVTVKGGRAVSESEAVEEAHRQASRLKMEKHHLKTKVSRDRNHALHPHRIDLATGEFVRLAPPELKRADGHSFVS